MLSPYHVECISIGKQENVASIYGSKAAMEISFILYFNIYLIYLIILEDCFIRLCDRVCYIVVVDNIVVDCIE